MIYQGLYPFLFENLDIRGQRLVIQQDWQKLLKDRHYPPIVRRLLGELLVFAISLAAQQKTPSKLIFQVKGDGPVNLLVVDVDQDLNFRGMAQWDEAAVAQHADDTPANLLGTGAIVLTLKNLKTDAYYQSLVPIHQTSLLASFDDYMRQSNQTLSHLAVWVDEQRLSGLVLQALPNWKDKDEDGWNRLLHLSQTLQAQEMHHWTQEQLAAQVYSEETLRIFTPQQVHFDCDDVKAKYAQVIMQIGQAEAQSILEEQGEIVITNEMCNQSLHFSAEEVAAIFAKPSIN